MNKNIKAALLSGLVFPGIGQIYKGCKLKGVILIVAVNVLFLIAVGAVVKEIYLLSASGGLSETQAPMQAVDRVIRDNTIFNGILVVLVVVWLYGILDALFYRTKNRTE